MTSISDAITNASNKASSYVLEPSSIATDISEKLSATTKKRGRQPKTSVGNTDTTPAAKKKRGRPRKTDTAK